MCCPEFPPVVCLVLVIGKNKGPVACIRLSIPDTIPSCQTLICYFGGAICKHHVPSPLLLPCECASLFILSQALLLSCTLLLLQGRCDNRPRSLALNVHPWFDALGGGGLAQGLGIFWGGGIGLLGILAHPPTHPRTPPPRPTEGQNEQWREANRRRQRQTIRYRGLVPTASSPPRKSINQPLKQRPQPKPTRGNSLSARPHVESTDMRGCEHGGRFVSVWDSDTHGISGGLGGPEGGQGQADTCSAFSRISDFLAPYSAVQTHTSGGCVPVPIHCGRKENRAFRKTLQ